MREHLHPQQCAFAKTMAQHCRPSEANGRRTRNGQADEITHNKNTKNCSAKHRRAEAARAATRAIHFCDRAATRKTKSCATGQRVRQRTAPSGHAQDNPWGEGHRPHQTKCPGSSGYHCGCSPRRLENSAAQTPDITRMYVPDNCARPRARAHLVMCPWVFAQIPSEHPCANASTHKMRLRDNTGATLSPT